jgi:type IV secretory pathway TrbF-like protein
MREVSRDTDLVKQHALEAIEHLSDQDKQKVVEYIKNLIILEKAKKNDEARLT